MTGKRPAPKEVAHGHQHCPERGSSSGRHSDPRVANRFESLRAPRVPSRSASETPPLEVPAKNAHSLWEGELCPKSGRPRYEGAVHDRIHSTARYVIGVLPDTDTLLLVLLAVFPVFGVAIVAWIEGEARSWVPREAAPTCHLRFSQSAGSYRVKPIKKEWEIWVALIGYIVSIVTITGATIATGYVLSVQVNPCERGLTNTFMGLACTGVIVFLLASATSVVRRATIALNHYINDDNRTRRTVIAWTILVCVLGVASYVVVNVVVHTGRI
jgi:hypothetical protein